METKDFKISNIFETDLTAGGRKIHGVRYTLPKGKGAFLLEDIRKHANKIKKKLAADDPRRKYVFVSTFSDNLGWTSGGYSRINEPVRFYNLYDQDMGDILAFTIYYDEPARVKDVEPKRKKVKRIV